MHRTVRARQGAVAVAIAAVLGLSGCTSLRDYVHNGFKVGPNYRQPPAPVACHWIEAANPRVRSEPADLSRWWCVLNDRDLNRLVQIAVGQNLTLREAGFRVLEARAQLCIARGEFFPQLQTATGSYRRQEISLNPPVNGPTTGIKRAFDQWNFGFNLAWELDFWGRFRRAITAAEDQLDASVFGYDEVLVTLLGDVALNYVEIRTDQERIKFLEENVKNQETVLQLVRQKQSVGTGSPLDVLQAEANVAQTKAAIPPLWIDMRQANDRLCTLLGIPSQDLTLPPDGRNPYRIGVGNIPPAPPALVVGIPADLLRRRPDVRQAERLAAAQAEQIGIAEAELYPAFTINGNLGWQARNLSHLFTEQAFTGSISPSFQWNLLNYGRIVNNIKFQDARFCELVAAYQQLAIQADQEVEDGIVNFLQSQIRTDELHESVTVLRSAKQLALVYYEKGISGVPKIVSALTDFNRYSVLEQNYIQQQDQEAASRGQIVQGLIQVYRALGGGWEAPGLPPPGAGPPPPPPGGNEPAERLPLPPPMPPRPPAIAPPNVPPPEKPGPIGEAQPVTPPLHPEA